MSQLVRIHENELLKGYCERLYMINPYLTMGVLFEEMFGERVLRIHPYVPSHINRITNGLGGYFTAEELINNHTLYNFYTAFQGKDIQQAIYRKMGIDYGNAYKIIKYNEIGISKYYKYCPLCVKEQLEQHGDFSWNRIHQIAPVCTKHGVWIQESTFPMKYRMDEYSKYMNQMDLQEMCKMQDLENFLQTSLEKGKKVSELIELLINGNYEKSITLNIIRDAYYCKLREKGLLYPSGESIYLTELIQQVEVYFTKELLGKIGVSPEKCVTKALNRFSNIVHPLYHVIMLIFLDIDITAEIPKQIFQIPSIPFYCLNPLNNHEANHIIDDVKVHYCYITKQHMCTFSCSCGFVFTTRLDEVIKSQGNKIGKIKSFGKVYEKRLLALRHLGIKGLARKTGINHGTIRKQLRNFDEYGTIVVSIEEKKVTTEVTIEEIAATVNVDEEKPQKEWRKKKWDEKDKSYYSLIKFAVQRELEGGQRPIRITRTRLAKNIGAVHALVYNIEKMPCTKALIEQCEETQEQYYRRKIEWAIRILQERGEGVLEWKVLKVMGVKDSSNLVKQLIKEAIWVI